VVTDPIIDLVGQHFLDAMATFKEHIADHWPADDSRDLDEANLVLQLAIRLSGSAVRVYQEVYHPASGGTLDLYALDVSRRWALALEAKRLKGGAEARSLGAQATRLSRLHMPSGAAAHRSPTDCRCLTALMAHIWYGRNEPVVDWWRQGPGREPTPGIRSAIANDWSELGAFLATAHTWSADLTVKTQHWALFAVSENPVGSFWR
jgi:hypothetical protein